MKIHLDENSYIEIKLDHNKKLALCFKTKKDKKSTIALTAKLNSKQLDDLITQLVSMKMKVK